MRRETSNQIRFLIEDVLPPLLRDSSAFCWFAQLVWGRHIVDLAQFRARAPFLSASEYEALYRAHPRIHHNTDNSEACIHLIAQDVVGTSVCDVGCGTGYLLTRLLAAHPELTTATGVDFVINDAASPPGITYVEAKIEALPFADDHFDTVICTHVIEHILDFRRAIAELRRITRKRLIIVVPREREAEYSFNPHFNFFPYAHSFLRAMIPVPTDFICQCVGRDIYYCEDLTGGPSSFAAGERQDLVGMGVRRHSRSAARHPAQPRQGFGARPVRRHPADGLDLRQAG